MNKKQYNKKQYNKKSKTNQSGFDEEGKICPVDQFFDILHYLEATQHMSCLTKLSFGNLQLDNLTQLDHKKHGAIYVSLIHMEQLTKFLEKKFNGKIPIKMFALLNQTREAYADLLPTGVFITGEHMGGQNLPYNKVEKQFVALHGSLELNIDEQQISFPYLEEICEMFKIEGYVFVTSDGDRGKLKRAYFPNGTVQKGEHKLAPEIFTPEGLKLCSDGKFSYDNAAIVNVEKPVIIAQVQTCSLTLLPYADIIKKQIDKPFDGDKMFNVMKVKGSKQSYMYDEEVNPDINFVNSKVEIKHNGETVVMCKTLDGEFHLMVKLQVHVWQVIGDNKELSYRIGWKNT